MEFLSQQELSVSEDTNQASKNENFKGFEKNLEAYIEVQFNQILNKVIKKHQKEKIRLNNALKDIQIQNKSLSKQLQDIMIENQKMKIQSRLHQSKGQGDKIPSNQHAEDESPNLNQPEPSPRNQNELNRQMLLTQLIAEMKSRLAEDLAKTEDERKMHILNQIKQYESMYETQ